MENEEDPNIKLLETLNFKEVKIKKVNSVLLSELDPGLHSLIINTTVEEIPTSNNIIVDIEKFYDIYLHALRENETTHEDHERVEHETTIYFFIAVELDNLINYRLYLKNMNSLKNKGITNCFILFNKYYYEKEEINPELPKLQNHNIYTIREIINNYNVPDADISFALSGIYSEEYDEDYITDFNNNALFFNVSQNVINREIIEKKNKKSYDFLLAYFLHHEQKHRNRNKIKNKDIINLLL